MSSSLPTTEQIDPTATSGGPMLVGSHDHASRTGTPPERFTSSDPEAFEIPTGFEEVWRFTPSRPLRAMQRSLAGAARPTVAVDAPDGVEVSAVGPTHPSVGSVLRPADRISALAFAEVSQALLIKVSADAGPEPIVVEVTGTAGLATQHIIIDVAANATAKVVVHSSGTLTLGGNVEIRVGDGANLSTVFVQDWDHDAIQVEAHAIQVGRDASIRHTVINLGGALVRLSPSVSFAGPGGRAELFGVSFAGSGQHHEVRLYVDHNEPDCSSDVLYKNALDGEGARTVWIGDVRIRPRATGTRTFELNRNLVLTDGARADSVPNLEIETGEIAGAGHASATGRFDDLQLFYLQARGIPESEARRLVVRGFFADVIDRIGLPELQQQLMDVIEARLGGQL
jgi:Fe-S cluster assembly protein SufD